MTMSIRRLIIFCIFVTYSHITVHSKDFIKGAFSIGLDGLFGDFDSNQKLGGGILHGGYDFFFHRISFLSVEPKIGVGYFGGNKTSTLSTAVVANYGITCFTTSISPKVYCSLNPDNNILLSLENEFSLLNGFANIKDQNSIHVRRNSKFFQFYYTVKIGLTLKTPKGCKFTVWVGGSTLRLDNILNGNIPSGEKYYSKETLPYAAGINFYI